MKTKCPTFLPLLPLASLLTFALTGCAINPAPDMGADASTTSVNTSDLQTICGIDENGNWYSCDDSGGGGGGGTSGGGGTGGTGGGGGGGSYCSPTTCQPQDCWPTQNSNGGWGYLCIHNASADVGCAVSGCTSCTPPVNGAASGCFTTCDGLGLDSYQLANCYVACWNNIRTTCQ